MIRPGTRADAEQMDSVDPFAGDRRKEADEGRLFVWEENKVAAAYISIASFRFHGRPYVEFLFVRSDLRRRGIASQLLSCIEDRFRGHRLFLSTEDDNLPMLQLLRARGYTEAGGVAGLNPSPIRELFFYRDVE